MSEKVDFAALKQAVSIEAAASWLGLDLSGADVLRCECPIHGGGKRSLVITPAKQAFYCFAPGVKEGGDCIQLVAHCLKLDTRTAALELQKRFGAPEGLQKVAEYLLFDHPQVQALGLDKEAAQKLQIGYAPKGIMKGRVLIALRTAKGDLVGYVGYSDSLA